MFVDASAIVAVIVGEPDAPALRDRLAATRSVQTSPLALYEATLGTARSLNIPVAQAAPLVDEFVIETAAEIIPITAAIGREAIRAFERYGRGRHPAVLNLGDCLAYACARVVGVPLLYKGDDFAQTDLGGG